MLRLDLIIENLPSGSSHIWCLLPLNNKTLDSMDGQYLEKISFTSI